MPYDRCEVCEHIWHGLPCGERLWVRDEELQRWSRVPCECPSAWQEPAVLADPQVLEVDPPAAAASHDVHDGVALL